MHGTIIITDIPVTSFLYRIVCRHSSTRIENTNKIVYITRLRIVAQSVWSTEIKLDN